MGSWRTCWGSEWEQCEQVRIERVKLGMGGNRTKAEGGIRRDSLAVEDGSESERGRGSGISSGPAPGGMWRGQG